MSADQCETLLSWFSQKTQETEPLQSGQKLIPVEVPIQKGKWNILTGSTGVGKSTFLTQRQDEGNRSVLLPQRLEILPLSIRDNLTLGKSLSEEKLNEVIRGLDLDSVLKRLPEGIETVLSRNGAPLSGGETQRLCIARVLLQEADEVLLDEPTSAQSEVQEERLLEFLKTYLNGKTVISVTHRPAVKRYSEVHWLIEGWGKVRQEVL